MGYGFAQNGPGSSASFAAYFVNPSLLMLAALAIVPIILHFLLRNKPKKLLFPALRLLQLRKKNNVRRLRLKHVWLLLLRIAVILLIVFALARPTLPAANYTPNAREFLTIFAIVAVAVAAYYAVLHRWRKQRVPNHALVYRRTLLRAGTGIGILLLFLLLFVWPYTNRVFAEIDAPPPDAAKNLPVAAVFLFDNSLRMGYQFDNQTRLERAAEIAGEHLQTFKHGSKVAVATTSGQDSILFQVDLAAVKDRIDPSDEERNDRKLKVDPLSTGKLDRLLLAAIRRQVSDRKKTQERTATDTFLREIYIFTDLSTVSWDPTEFDETRSELAKHKWLHVYVIDVGVKDPVNVAVTGIDLSRPAVAQGEDLYVRVKMKAEGPERVERVLKLNFLDETGNATTRDKARITLEPGLEVTHRFTLANLRRPFQQAEAKLEAVDAADPLEEDNTRLFTVTVHPRPKVLIVSDSAADAYLWRQSLAPEFLGVNEQWFHCSYLPTTKLAGTDLSKFNVVYLINVRKPTKEIWESLEKYIQAGGGVGVALGVSGNQETVDAYKMETALKVLPAKPLGQVPFQPEQYLNPVNQASSIFATFEKLGFGTLTNEPIFKYWRVENREGATAVATYTGQRPDEAAIITRDVGRGRSLMVTTAVNRDDEWNTLSLAGWRYVELAHAMTRYLTGHDSRTANFQPGDAVRVYWSRSITTPPTILRRPQTQIRLDNGDVNEHSLALSKSQLTERGNYQLFGGEDGTRLMAGFSYNIAPEQSELKRLTDDQLDEIFGEDRYQVARDLQSLQRSVGLTRAGVEVFPLVVAVLLLIFCGEHFVANRFYQADQAAEHQAAWG